MCKKRIFRSFFACFVGVLALVGMSAPAEAWKQSDAWKIVDYETHNRIKNFGKGSYFDWTDQAVGWQVGNGWPFTYNFYHRYTTSNGGKQRRYGIAAWVVKIPKTGWYDIRSNFKRTENRTTAAQYYTYSTTKEEMTTKDTVTINDFIRKIDNKTLGDPLAHKVVDQHGPNAAAGAWYYAELGAVCLEAGNFSVVVLDSRDAERSTSADATFWTYLGKKHKGQSCPKADVIVSPAITHLLLRYEPPPPPILVPIRYLLLKK